MVLDPLTGDAFCRRTAIHRPEAIAMANAENAYEKTLLERAPAAAAVQEKKIELF